MAYFKGSAYSETLKMRTGITMISPKYSSGLREKPAKTVFLLHGLSDNCDDWAINSQLSLLANDYRLIFILPEVQRSFYTDMAYGPAYFSYVADELPRLCANLFPVSLKREDTYVMGLSMGGYGALKCALLRPEQFAGCAAFSSVCILEECEEMADDAMRREIQGILGLHYELLRQNELMEIVSRFDPSAPKPNLFLTCGTEDFLYRQNVRFSDFIKGKGFPAVFQSWSGRHEWYFWNKSIHLACDHFFERQSPDPPGEAI